MKRIRLLIARLALGHKNITLDDLKAATGVDIVVIAKTLAQSYADTFGKNFSEAFAKELESRAQPQAEPKPIDRPFYG